MIEWLRSDEHAHVGNQVSTWDFFENIYLLFSKLTEEKTKEKDALDEAVKQVRSKTTTHINEMHTEVDDKIKTMAWNSHARQTKAMEACSKLKREFDESLGEHVISETDLRHENIRLETEISQMIKEWVLSHWQILKILLMFSQIGGFINTSFLCFHNFF